MATASAATAVKSLNNAGVGRRRFVFKAFSQRIGETHIDVYRSRVPLKAEPSEGSSFFLDCLVEYRELNTAEDFISFYEETLPLVQTLPQIILRKDLIISNILSRLKIEGRLSLEPMLRLIAALSRDLLDDFLPYLPRIADSLESLLESGADRDPEIIEQIFTSWSYIMMYLQNYLTKDVEFILRITAKLRYYSKDYIREFMAESVSFLLRKTPIQLLKKGIKSLISEVVDEQSEMKTSSVGALLSHVMRITPLKLHSRKEKLMEILLDDSIFQIGDQSIEGSNAVLEVLIQIFQRSLDEELDSLELAFVLKYLCDKIRDSVTNEKLLHLSRLLALLISIVQIDNRLKISDFEPMVHLAELLVQKFVIPHLTVEMVDLELSVTEKVLQLMLCIIDGLFMSTDVEGLRKVSLEWEQVFDLRSQSLLGFIEEVLTKNPSIVHLFGKQIIRSFDNLIGTLNEEVVNLMISFCEKLEGESISYMNGKYKEKPTNVHHFFEETLRLWTGKLSVAVRGNLVPEPFQQNELAVLWGVVRCYSFLGEAKTNLSSLMDLIDAIDEFLAAKIEFGDFSPSTWQSLIGEALHSYQRLAFSESIDAKESAMSKFLDLAKKYKLSPQILSAAANMMESVSWKCQSYLSVNDVLDVFSENLCHANKEIRLCTLRVLCYCEQFLETEIAAECDSRTDASESSHVDNSHGNVLRNLKSIEEITLSVETSRKVILLITNIETSLKTHRVPIQYIPAVLNGIIGIFHNRFSYLWNPALKCLTVLIEHYCKTVWNGFITYLEHSQSLFLVSHDKHGRSNIELNKDTGGLLGRFSSEISPKIDSTPLATVFSLLIQSLQEVPSVAESPSRQLIPLFFKFLGHGVDEITSDGVEITNDHKGKEWKVVLKDWLSLFQLFRNTRALYQEKTFKDVLLYRLLDQRDADIQMKVLDCLMNWKDDFLVPYRENLKNLINSKTLSDELTRWSLSRNSVNAIDDGHRANVVPIVIRILISKVRNLKALAGQKNARVNHRKAVLGFLTGLDIDELPLFFWLLMKPLISDPHKDQEMYRNFQNICQNSKDEAQKSDILKHFTSHCINALPWKKKYGFLHVVEEIFAVFDESHLNPFLDLLVNCVARILASCTSFITSSKNDGLSSAYSSAMDVDDHNDTENQVMERTSIKQFKDLRSFCLKIIHQVLSKYDNHDFGAGFWDLFFTSVKPLITNFKQEGASSEKPSSLFHCFLAMSKSYKFLPLLGKEESLIPDIFSILTVPSATESILSCVLKFIKNLLELDSKIDGEDATVQEIFVPHFDVLIHSLYSIFSDDGVKRSGGKVPRKMELTIFKLLSKYVREPLAAEKFVDILLPLLTKKHQSSDTCVEVLQIVRQMVAVLGNISNKRILKAITPLLISSGLDIRITICDLLDTIAANDSSVSILATILHDLNATSNLEMGGLDYDKILAAYDRVNLDFFRAIREEHIRPILAHSVYDMSSGDLVLRQSALRLLLCFIEFSGGILNGSSEFDHIFSKTSVKDLVNDFILKHMGNAMDKDIPVKKVWIDLLREMVLKLPEVANLGSYKALYSDDTEQDFFSNVVHLQKHRRARALNRFTNVVSSGNLSEAITNKVFIPLLFSMLFDAQDGKDEHIRSACIDALASISHTMNWTQYYALLLRCFRDLAKKPDKQKIVLRLICSILDHFHFLVLPSENEAMVCDVPDPYTIEKAPLRKHMGSTELTVVQKSLVEKILPKVQKLLSSDSENINVHTSLVALKVLKLLPNEIMDSHLPSIIHRVSNFLKNRLESVRDEARSALTACLKELSVEYLQFIVKVLKGILKRGFESHVLGYTLNFMLSKLLTNPMCGKLDYCLEDLLSVVESDILGEVSDEKDVEKIASKMKETRKQKSFETLELIAKNITFKTHALKLLSPVTSNLKKQLTPKMKLKIENMLSHIASGIECNPSVNRTELFVFANCLIQDGIKEEGNGYESTKPGRLLSVDGRFSHLITAFGLGVLQNYMKKLKLDKDDGELLSLLDPFIGLLGQCLSSKYENITTAALRCLSPLVKLPLPSLQSEANNIKNSLLIIAQGSILSSNQLMEACIKLLTVLLRSTKITLSSDQLHMLIQFPLFVDLARNPSFVALSLLKAIVHRKLVVPEIYDVVQIVAELMVQSQQESIRKKCSEILLQFLLGYHLSEKRLQQHLDFLLANLRYEHSTGREAVLEMLHAIILKFPRTIVDVQSQTMFVHLVISLANDDDSKVRSMTAAAIKCLIGHVSSHSLRSILEYSLSWYLGGKHNLWAAAAQVLGLLVEVMGKKFEKHLSRVLPAVSKILQSAMSELSSNKQHSSDEGALPFWKESYYSLVMLEKILNQFPNLFVEPGLEDIWEAMCEFLLHPHLWLRNISNRILSYYFTAVTTTCRQNNDVSMESFLLMKPSILFHVAVSLCCQLNVPQADDSAGSIILQNLVFSIEGLQFYLGQEEYSDIPKYWFGLSRAEQDRFLKAFGALDPKNGKRTLATFTSDVASLDNACQHPFVSYLLQKIGKLSFQMETPQMKIIFNCYKSISSKLLGSYSAATPVDSDNLHSYAYQMLLPLYRVCEGYTGKVIPDDVTHLANEVCETIRDTIGAQNFVQIYSQIRKTVKGKRDKRKQEEKVMAVVNPARNAKRKIRAAEKHRAHKKRKIMSMKMGRWMR